MDAESDIEQLMGHLGEFGRYQMRQFTLHLLGAMLAGLHMLSLVTVAAVPSHHCALPGVEFGAANSSMLPQDNEGKPKSCYMYGADGKEVECEEWTYDLTDYKDSKGMRWNFVCNRRWMGAVAQTAFMFGVFTGAVILGGLADKCGRKIIFYISAIIQLILGVIVAFSPEYYSFLVLRYFLGIFGSAGAYVTGFVLTMELVGKSRRTVCGVATQGAFAVGVMLVALWGWLIKDSTYLQLTYGAHALLLMGHWWLMDESPRWLWAQGRFKEAVDIVAKGTRINGASEKLDVAHYVSRGRATQATKEEEKPNASIADLCRTRRLAIRMLNVSLNWFANSLVYYGLSLNTGKLEGNPYLLLFIIGLVEIPSYIMTIVLMDRTGRRCLISSLMILGGIACVVAVFIPQDTPEGGIAATTVVMVGKFFIAGSFAIIYNYTAEMFPTVVRNSSIGVGSMCARTSGALTPLITLLDSLDKKIPSLIFASISILSGLLSLFLPETLNKAMPQTIQEGEEFGKGDTAFTACFKRRNRTHDVPLTSH